MKKLFIIFAMFLLATPAFANTSLIVECLNGFTTSSPNENISVRALEDIEFDNGIIFNKNDIIVGNVIEVVDPKRAKRDSYIIIEPKFYKNSKGETLPIEQGSWSAKVVDYKPFSAKDAAEKAGVGVVNLFAQGASTVYYFGKGLIKPNEDENRIKSGVKSAWENSFLSYIEKGEAFSVSEGDLLRLVFFYRDVPKWKIWDRY